jgi:hypothetical protein
MMKVALTTEIGHSDRLLPPITPVTPVNSSTTPAQKVTSSTLQDAPRYKHPLS